MLQEHRADVETSTSLNADPKSVPSPVMSASFRDYQQQPRSRMSDASKREQSPHRLPPITNNAPQYPPPGDAWADALDRVHSELRYHNSLFEAQRRDFERLEAGLERLQADIGSCWAHLESFRAELRARPSALQERPDGGDLDILTGQVQNLTAKVPEIEGLKMQVDIMKRRVRRLEGVGSPPPSGPTSVELSPYQHNKPHPHAAPTPLIHGSAPSNDSRTLSYGPSTGSRLPPPSQIQSTDSRTLSAYPSSEESRTLPPFRAMEAASESTWRSAPSYHSSQRPNLQAEPPQVHPPEPQQPTGWAAVNANSNIIKRPAQDEHQGSPKRQKLATLMPRTSYGEQSVSSSHSYHPSVNGTPESTIVSSLQPTRTSSSDVVTQSQPFGTPSNPTGVQHPIRWVQFPSTQEGDSQDSWRPESQRILLESSRSRGGRGGRRSRGSRKSTVGSVDRDHDLASEYGGYAASSDSHYLYTGSPPQGGGGGGSSTFHPETPHSGPAPSETPTSDASKKSRTKPIRNADGILIRKDGRPDMRSVSSAMNLRKVHAKKEAERAGSSGEQGLDGETPTSGGDVEKGDTGTDESPGPVARSESREGGGGEGQSDLERHRENMRKIFPQGIVAEGAGLSKPPPPPPSRTIPESVLVGKEDGRWREDRQQDGRSQKPRMDPETLLSMTGVQVVNNVPAAPTRREQLGAGADSDSQMTDIAPKEMADAQMNEDRPQRMEVDGETTTKAT